jgi:hypothetical protein
LSIPLVMGLGRSRANPLPEANLCRFACTSSFDGRRLEMMRSVGSRSIRIVRVFQGLYTVPTRSLHGPCRGHCITPIASTAPSGPSRGQAGAKQGPTSRGQAGAKQGPTSRGQAGAKQGPSRGQAGAKQGQAGPSRAKQGQAGPSRARGWFDAAEKKFRETGSGALADGRTAPRKR